MIGYLKIQIIAFGNHFVKAKYRFMVFSICNMLDSSLLQGTIQVFQKMCIIFPIEILILIRLNSIHIWNDYFIKISNTRSSILYMIDFRCFDHSRKLKIIRVWFTNFFQTLIKSWWLARIEARKNYICVFINLSWL